MNFLYENFWREKVIYRWKQHSLFFYILKKFWSINRLLREKKWKVHANWYNNTRLNTSHINIFSRKKKKKSEIIICISIVSTNILSYYFFLLRKKKITKQKLQASVVAVIFSFNWFVRVYRCKVHKSRHKKKYVFGFSL